MKLKHAVAGIEMLLGAVAPVFSNTVPHNPDYSTTTIQSTSVPTGERVAQCLYSQEKAVPGSSPLCPLVRANHFEAAETMVTPSMTHYPEGVGAVYDPNGAGWDALQRNNGVDVTFHLPANMEGISGEHYVVISIPQSGDLVFLNEQGQWVRSSNSGTLPAFKTGVLPSGTFTILDKRLLDELKKTDLSFHVILGTKVGDTIYWADVLHITKEPLASHQESATGDHTLVFNPEAIGTDNVALYVNACSVNTGCYSLVPDGKGEYKWVLNTNTRTPMYSGAVNKAPSSVLLSQKVLPQELAGATVDVGVAPFAGSSPGLEGQSQGRITQFEATANITIPTTALESILSLKDIIPAGLNIADVKYNVTGISAEDVAYKDGIIHIRATDSNRGASFEIKGTITLKDGKIPFVLHGTIEQKQDTEKPKIPHVDAPITTEQTSFPVTAEITDNMALDPLHPPKLKVAVDGGAFQDVGTMLSQGSVYKIQFNSAHFGGAGHTYTFHVTATDQAGNTATNTAKTSVTAPVIVCSGCGVQNPPVTPPIAPPTGTSGVIDTVPIGGSYSFGLTSGAASLETKLGYNGSSPLTKAYFTVPSGIIVKKNNGTALAVGDSVTVTGADTITITSIGIGQFSMPMILESANGLQTLPLNYDIKVQDTTPPQVTSFQCPNGGIDALTNVLTMTLGSSVTCDLIITDNSGTFTLTNGGNPDIQLAVNGGAFGASVSAVNGDIIKVKTTPSSAGITNTSLVAGDTVNSTTIPLQEQINAIPNAPTVSVVTDNTGVPGNAKIGGITTAMQYSVSCDGGTNFGAYQPYIDDATTAPDLFGNCLVKVRVGQNGAEALPLTFTVPPLPLPQNISDQSDVPNATTAFNVVVDGSNLYGFTLAQVGSRFGADANGVIKTTGGLAGSSGELKLTGYINGVAFFDYTFIGPGTDTYQLKFDNGTRSHDTTTSNVFTMTTL